MSKTKQNFRISCFLYIYMHACVCVCVYACVFSGFTCVRFFVTPWTVARQALLSMGFSSKNTGVSCHSLLQGIFPTQESNLHFLPLLNCQVGFFFFFLSLVPPRKSYIYFQMAYKVPHQINREKELYLEQKRFCTFGKQCLHLTNY